MKRNDIGDSYVLGYSSGSLRRGEPSHPRGRSRRSCWKALRTTATRHPLRRTERLSRHAKYWKCPVVIVSIPLARRHGMRVVWRRRGAARALRHRNRVLRACVLVVIENDVSQRWPCDLRTGYLVEPGQGSAPKMPTTRSY